MRSSRKKTTSGSGPLIENQSLDWLSVMDLVLPYSSESFETEDWIALRTANKSIKQLVDPFLFTKLKLNIDTLKQKEYKAIAASPILKHVKELGIFVKNSRKDTAYMKQFWNRHKKALLSILSQVAPHLERLEISTHDQLVDFCLAARLLVEPYERYKHLKALEI